MNFPGSATTVRPSSGRFSRLDIPTGCRRAIWPCSMRAAELGAARVAVWGRGREGRAAIAFLRQRHPNLSLVLLDDNAGEPAKNGGEAGIECAFGAEQIARALKRTDIIVKSPGVSLYRPEIQSALA